MAFKSLSQQRPRLADEVYTQIMDAIQSGDISVDDRIVQEKLAEEFGISRTPIREALFRMEQEGILSVAGRGGFKIRKMDEQEIREIYEARCSVEAFAMRVLAQRNDRDVSNRLRQIVVDAENLEEKTVEAFFRANRKIHRAIVLASENRYLLEFFDNLWNRGSSITLFASLGSGDLSKSLGDHLSLIDAIESGNDSFAAEKMITHITEGYHLQVEGDQL